MPDVRYLSGSCPFRGWSTEAAKKRLPDMQRMKRTTTGQQTDKKRIKRSSYGYEVMMYEI